MNIIALIVCFVGYLNLVKAKENDVIIKNLLQLIKESRRHVKANDLPQPSGLLPGHSLIRPAKATLKSAVNFPHEHKKLVYGNLDNLGITDDENPLQVLYTGFRKENNILATIFKAAKMHGFNVNTDNPSVIIIQQKNLKSTPKENELTDDTLKISEFLKDIKNSAKYMDERLKDKLLTAKANKIKKKTEKIFGRPGHIKLNVKPRAETLNEHTKIIQDLLNGRVSTMISLKQDTSTERAWKVKELLNYLQTVNPKLSLDQKSKYIEDFLNNKLPVSNRIYLKEDTSTERAWKIKEYLKNLQRAKPKLSLDQKTKYIEDFLNNKVPVYMDGKLLNNQRENFYSESSSQSSIDEMENNANEILDNFSSEEIEGTDNVHNYRRSKKNEKFRDRDSKYESDTSEPSDASASSDYERNPGNPFTIHRNKYKKNWLWNHFMDGDHMNINPFGPPFANMGPSGVDLFFGRKWWYYNQDDYKPMG